MNRKVQKIQQVGNSAGILLPADWLARRGLKPGAKVCLEVTDQRITVFPDQEDREVAVDGKFAKLLKSFFRRNRGTLERLAR